MPMLLLLAGLVSLAGGLLTFLQGAIQPDLRILDPVGSTVASVGGLILVGMGSVAARLQRIADAIESQAVRDALAPSLESMMPASGMGAAAVAAALGDHGDRSGHDPHGDDDDLAGFDRDAGAAPPRQALQPTIALRPAGLSGELRLDGPAGSPAFPGSPQAPAEWPRIEPADRLLTPATAGPGAGPGQGPGHGRAPSLTLDGPAFAGPAASPVHAPSSTSHASAPGSFGSAGDGHDFGTSSRHGASHASVPHAASVTPAPEDALATGWSGQSDAEPPPMTAPAGAAAPAGPGGLRVLKSGVIEGMAYTLYSDGSVDAELREGTRHFASIADWRAHLRDGV